MQNNNQAIIAGMVVSDFTFSHYVLGEGFYRVDISVKRLSDTFDVIPVIVSERLVDIKQSMTGKFVEIIGQFRSYNRHEESRNRLVLSVFAKTIQEYKPEAEGQDLNSIILNGYVCKRPAYRKTPLGREIADILLAVNRPYGKSDYIPCICWGRNARFADNLEVGGHIQVWGRIQSREYQKTLNEGKIENKIAYEVSINRMELGTEDNKD